MTRERQKLQEVRRALRDVLEVLAKPRTVTESAAEFKLRQLAAVVGWVRAR